MNALLATDFRGMARIWFLVFVAATLLIREDPRQSVAKQYLPRRRIRSSQSATIRSQEITHGIASQRDHGADHWRGF